MVLRSDKKLLSSEKLKIRLLDHINNLSSFLVSLPIISNPFAANVNLSKSGTSSQGNSNAENFSKTVFHKFTESKLISIVNFSIF